MTGFALGVPDQDDVATVDPARASGQLCPRALTSALATTELQGWNCSSLPASQSIRYEVTRKRRSPFPPLRCVTRRTS